ncbi:hypothetical protein [uncultured Endozoicomonas sp.]|uniref:hypothetical protein n=1 Tax=uncultured Endozoicomonas sp. TaxID=432652 RepID=UPI0026270521|nr:hypothetical protein [uncultured Endozoicomonas sp.]
MPSETRITGAVGGHHRVHQSNNPHSQVSRSNQRAVKPAEMAMPWMKSRAEGASHYIHGPLLKRGTFKPDLLFGDAVKEAAKKLDTVRMQEKSAISFILQVTQEIRELKKRSEAKKNENYAFLKKHIGPHFLKSLPGAIDEMSSSVQKGEGWAIYEELVIMCQYFNFISDKNSDKKSFMCNWKIFALP